MELPGHWCFQYFREANGDPRGDAESFNLILAPGKETQNDLLFIGGDFDNQPFAEYGCVKKQLLTPTPFPNSSTPRGGGDTLPRILPPVSR